MGLITSSGIGSGIDIESIIGAILDAERVPKESSLIRNEQRVESTLSALGKLSSSLSTLDDALNNLNSIADFRIRAATSSDEDFLTATANTEASSGTFAIDVDTLAKGSRFETVGGTFTDTTDTVGSGNLTFTAGSETFDVAVDAADTLEDIRNNINAASDNFGVNANIVNGLNGPVLVFTSSITGDGNTLAVTNDDASLDDISTNLSQIYAANSAIAFVDGIQVTSDTNTFTDAIQDVTFTAVKETVANEPITLTVEIDKEGVKETIQAFVDAINEYQSTVQELGASSELSTGPLAGDVTLRLLSQQVNNVIQGAVSGITSDFNSLNSLGISFDEFGKINLDEDALDSVLDTNFNDIAEVFASTNGVSIQLQSIVDNYNGGGNIIDIRETSLNNQKRRLETDRLNFEYRIEQLEVQLRRKFGAMDSLVAQFNNTGNYLSQQLANLPGFGSGSSSS
jgi:flagellar hook-associated protein 2